MILFRRLHVYVFTFIMCIYMQSDVCSSYIFQIFISHTYRHFIYIFDIFIAHIHIPCVCVFMHICNFSYTQIDTSVHSLLSGAYIERRKCQPLKCKH